MRKLLFMLAGGMWLASCAIAQLPAQSARNDKDCLTCHGPKSKPIKVADGENDDGEAVERTMNVISPAKVAKGVHAGMYCVDCHADITDAPKPGERHHRESSVKPPECASCHEKLLTDREGAGRNRSAVLDGDTGDKAASYKPLPAIKGETENPWKRTEAAARDAPPSRLAIVAENIRAYRRSFHARPSEQNPKRAIATCTDCHDTHTFDVPPRGTEARTAWHMTVPNICGRCHEDALEEYGESVHGKAVLEKHDSKGAVCADCHTTHDIGNTSANPVKLAITENCGSCHQEQLKSYRGTYHGQVTRLGFAYTAKCYDCHGSHEIVEADDPASKVHPDNRLKTCRKCHDDRKAGMRTATAGFATFGPHATGHDFAKYPQMWIATKFMVGLLIFVFAFFWAHSGLWYYREWMDRKQGKPHARVDLRGMNLDTSKHFRRFHWGWRIAHLAFALITMALVLTGTTALFADSPWAPTVAATLGGPKMLGLIHRVCAFLFVGIFMVHFLYVMQKLLRSKTFRWFGPDSLIPNWKDFADCWGMFKWFLGKGPRPMFERWAYYEKFDYWAVFWGVNIIGWSGLMLAFPHVTAEYLPGWVFNVATLVHGEEAFLAAVFLFTVHFFNNHFRPDKLPPPDIVMFTGTQSLTEFRHDHPAHYQRMVDTGQIEKFLVDAPSARMTLGSKILGLVLIAVGLTLLVLVVTGFLSGL